MATTFPILPINYAIERSIVDYLSGSLSNQSSSLSGSVVHFYTGIDNEDKAAPSVTIIVGECREVAPYTQIYETEVDVVVAEMAADTGVLGELVANVFNIFYSKCGADTSVTFNGNGYNFFALQVQTLNLRHSVKQDALINTGTFRFVGGLNIT